MIPQNIFRLVPAPIRRALRSRLRSESGATLVETALSISLLLTFMFGIIEVSLGLYSYHFISDAAREGTRYAIVRGSTWGVSCASYSSAGCTASPQNISDYVTNLAFPGINPGKMTVTPKWMAAPGGASCSTCTAAGDVVQVQVQYTFPFSVPFVPQATWTMSSESEMTISQ